MYPSIWDGGGWGGQVSNGSWAPGWTKSVICTTELRVWVQSPIPTNSWQVSWGLLNVRELHCSLGWQEITKLRG